MSDERELTHSSNGQALVKILLPLPEGKGGVEFEGVWAAAVQEDLYRVENCPFFAYNISLGDVVYAPYDIQKRCPIFQRVEDKSGNSTIRVLFDAPAGSGTKTDVVIKLLSEEGCICERYSKNYFSFNVPLSVGYQKVRGFLQGMGISWEDADSFPPEK